MPQEILKYMFGEAMPECSVCPEKIETVEARQLFVEEVKQTREWIREEKYAQSCRKSVF